jgi:antitoxin component YwqK of YwqJK toxin-antitoxin module
LLKDAYIYRMQKLLILSLLLLVGFNGFGQDTTVVIGHDPAYMDTTYKLVTNLKDKIAPGVYMRYTDKCRYNRKLNKRYPSYPKDSKCQGELREKCTYGKDSLISNRVTYYSGGIHPSGIINYKDGLWHGVSIEYNGHKIYTIGSYKADKKHGTWFYLGKKGTEPLEGNYIDGILQDSIK